MNAIHSTIHRYSITVLFIAVFACANVFAAMRIDSTFCEGKATPTGVSATDLHFS